MFKAVAYYGGIPPNNNNLEKPLILDNFLEGVRVSGDEAVGHRGMNAIACDVALIQGFVHEHGKTAPHLVLRQQAVDLQKSLNKKSLIVDSNLFLYADPSNTKHYLRYSFNGIFPTTGFYFDTEPDPTRWEKIRNNLGINLKPWRTDGTHVLVCLQRHGGWSMRGLSVQHWLDDTIVKIRQTMRKIPIMVRLHPGDKKMPRMIRINHKNVTISRNPRITDDLRTAWATVVYNSSPSVASIIEGVPTFLTDPEPMHSQSYPVANLNLADLPNPKLPERQEWIEKLSMCHWNFEELKSGEAWQFFRKFI